MGKLVVLTLGEGSFEGGFSAIMRMGEDGEAASTEISGQLPAAPNVIQSYRNWQSAVRGSRGERLEAKSMPSNISFRELSEQLRVGLNSWLSSPEFRPIWDKLLEKLTTEDEVRAIVQCSEEYLWRLPWHLWEFFDRYPKAELAVSAPKYERVTSSQNPNKINQTKVRILAILGNSAGIDIEKDRAILE